MGVRIFERPINRSIITNIAYPVGSIYMSVSNVNPETIFINTEWVQLQDRFLIAAGQTYEGGTTGGSATVDITPSGTVEGTYLSTEQIPSHSHLLNEHSHGAGTLKTNATGSHTHDTKGNATASLNGSGNEARTQKRASGGGGWKVPNDDGMAASGLHSHTLNDNYTVKQADGNTGSYGQGNSHAHPFTGITETVNVLPPYLPVYMWRRTR